mgnify:FL=1
MPVGGHKRNRYMNKNKKSGSKKLHPDQMKDQIFKIFIKKPKKRYTPGQINSKLGKGISSNAVKDAIDALQREGILYDTGNNKYRLDRNIIPEEAPDFFPRKSFIGKVDMTRSGAAYVIVDGEEEDIYVTARNLGGAYDGDTVRVEVQKSPGRFRIQGKIVEIINRKLTQVMGVLHILPKYGVVVPLIHDRSPKVHIHINELDDIQNGSYVIAEISQWGMSQNKGIWGSIVKVLEDVSESEIAMQGIIASNGFEIDFPENVMTELDNLDESITTRELARRKDFRKITTFTIDPHSARDFDDALSVDFLENGTVEIGVHIADVTHYVKEGSKLDKEALKRSTSVYLVDRVVPMLPEKISNDLCSLNPNEDKLVFSCSFVFNEDGKLLKTWFGKAIIHSDKRFTYEEAQTILETGKGEFVKELNYLNRIAGILREKRFEYGSIGFESDEVYFELDDNDAPVSVYIKERKDAHKLVEEFMLLANRKVAEYIIRKSKGKEIPFVYRIHDHPDPQKLADFALFAKEMGIGFNMDTPRQVAQSFNLIAEKALENDAFRLLEPLAIRTMAKAEYSSNNIGHYGLAFENYTHFTSPIRRYADVLVHRLLFENLENEFRTNKEKLELQCKHISNQERKANQAERESVKYKQVEFIQKFVGEVMEGYISGIIDRGVFVALLPSLAEGLISFQAFDEPYIVPESRLFAKGKYSGHKIKMGDKISVRVLDADLDVRQIELEKVRFIDEGT